MYYIWITDIVVPSDGRTKEQELKNVEMHQNLTEKIQRLQKTSPNAIPIVVGSLEAVVSLDERMSMLDVEKRGRRSTIL